MEQVPSAIRPYVITGGRSDSGGDPLPWETLVIATGRPAPPDLQPEHLEILGQCQGLLSLAEVAAHLGQPAPVVQVLLADLLDRGLLTARGPVRPAERPDPDMLEKLLHGLHSRL
ncbi:DUF742 domain-containing protein [Streptomyces sp. NPDC059740]|uniref:DUF742 domain-containing protein n=1 Tax=Streptomyces sp. NPDC059740 TaxID=3346926 RepID=UPI0036495068